MNLKTFDVFSKTVVFSFVLAFHAWANTEAHSYLKKINKVVEMARKNVEIPGEIPSFKAPKWRVHVLAEEEIINDNVEAPANSLVYIGKRLMSQKLIIHGDGILYVEDEVTCPLIDIKGKALVIFNANQRKYFGGIIKIGSGAIISRKANSLDVRIRGGGALLTGADNKGEIHGDGQIVVHVSGHQEGDIHLGKGSGSSIRISGHLFGKTYISQNVTLDVSNSVRDDIYVSGDLKMTCPELFDASLEVTGQLYANLGKTTIKKKKEGHIHANVGEINISGDNNYGMVFAKNGKVAIGRANTGEVVSKAGDLKLIVTDRQKGDVVAGKNLIFKADSSYGECRSGGYADIEITRDMESYLVKTGGRMKLKTKVFMGNIDVKDEASIQVDDMLAGDFYYSASVGSGTINVSGDNELNVKFITSGTLSVGKTNRSNLKFGGDAKVTIGESNRGRLLIARHADVTVGDHQHGNIHVGGNARQIKVGTAHRSIEVVGQAKISLGKSVKTPYDHGKIKIAHGEINIVENNTMDILSTSKSYQTSVFIGKDNFAEFNLAGTGKMVVKGRQLNDGQFGSGGEFSAKFQKGKLIFGGAMKVTIQENLMGDLNIGLNNGHSLLNIGHIIDSNVAVHGKCSLNTQEILDKKVGREEVFIKSGQLLAKANIEANLSSEGETLIRARNIYGNVDIGGENSKVDAIVKGQLKLFN